MSDCLAMLEIWHNSQHKLLRPSPGPADYSRTSVASGFITADASLQRFLVRGELIYEVLYAGSPVGTIYSHRK